MNVKYRAPLRQLLIELLIAGLIFLLGLNSQLTESLYSRGLYPLISIAQRFVSSLLFFPLGDFLYLLLCMYILWKVTLFFKCLLKKQLKKEDKIRIPLQVINFILLLYIIFKVVWGLNYSRIPIASSLGIAHKKYDNKQLVLLGRFMISKLNELEPLREKKAGINTQTYPASLLQNKAAKAYSVLEKTQSFFRYKVPVVKPVLNSWIVSTMGIQGYYCPLSGEANVNMRQPVPGLPFVTCHEIAHQLGVAREDEANLVGYMVAIASDDPDFRYSGYYSILRNVMFELMLKSPKEYKLLYESINPKSLEDYKNDREFWKRYNGELSTYFGQAFDRFLKINNQKKGIDSYQDIVLWVFNLHAKELQTTTIAVPSP